METRVLVAVTLLGATWAEPQDLTISYRGGPGSPMVIHHMSETALRVSAESGDRIVRADSEKFIVVDSGRKEYYETSGPEMRRLVSARSATGDRRANGLSRAAATIARADGKRTVAGYPCDRHIVSWGASSLEVWMAPDLPRPAHYLDSWYISYLARSPFSEFAEKAIEVLKDIEGIPLEVHWKPHINGHTPHLEAVAADVKQDMLPESTFQPPARYRRVPVPANGLGF